jgi:superfamily II DNA helicase RecQ
LALLISDGVVDQFGASAPSPVRSRKAKLPQARNGKAVASSPDPVSLSSDQEALAARIKEWRAAEAKRLGVPAYVILHDRSLKALAQARPRYPNQLLGIEGIGAAKVERFGADLLRLCSDA